MERWNCGERKDSKHRHDLKHTISVSGWDWEKFRFREKLPWIERNHATRQWLKTCCKHNKETWSGKIGRFQTVQINQQNLTQRSLNFFFLKRRLKKHVHLLISNPDVFGCIGKTKEWTLLFQYFQRELYLSCVYVQNIFGSNQNEKTWIVLTQTRRLSEIHQVWF